MSDKIRQYQENLKAWTSDREGWLKDREKALRLCDEKKLNYATFSSLNAIR